MQKLFWWWWWCNVRKSSSQSDERCNCFQGNVGGTSERRGGEYMGFPEHGDIILNWTELHRPAFAVDLVLQIEFSVCLCLCPRLLRVLLLFLTEKQSCLADGDMPVKVRRRAAPCLWSVAWLIETFKWSKETSCTLLMVSLSFCRPAEIVENGAVYPASNGYASPRAGARQSECPIRPPTLRLSTGLPTHTHRRITQPSTCPSTHSPLVHSPTLHLCVYPPIHPSIHSSIHHPAVHFSCPPNHPHSKSIQPLTRLPRSLALPLTHPPIHPATTHTPSIHHPPSTHPPTYHPSTHPPSTHHPPPTIHPHTHHPPTYYPHTNHPPTHHPSSSIHPPFIHPPTRPRSVCPCHLMTHPDLSTDKSSPWVSQSLVAVPRKMFAC